MYIRNTFKKGDIVFASTYGYKPYPAKITLSDEPNGIYRVKFIKHKSTAKVDYSMVQQFNQHTISKYENMYKNSLIAEEKSILGKIKAAKIQYYNMKKNKSKSRACIQIQSNVLSNRPLTLHPKSPSQDSKSLNKENDSNNKLGNEYSPAQDRIVIQKAANNTNNNINNCQQIQQVIKMSEALNTHKNDNKTHDNIMKLVSKICSKGPPYDDLLDNIDSIEDNHNYSQFKAMVKSVEQSSPTLNKSTASSSKKQQSFPQRSNRVEKKENKEESFQQYSQQSSQFPTLYLNDSNIHTDKNQEIIEDITKQLDKIEYKQSVQPFQQQSLQPLEDILEQGQSQELQVKGKSLNRCLNIDLDNADCSYDQMELEQGDSIVFYDKMAYRRIKIGIYRPSNNIDRINRYMDILSAYFERVKVRPKHRLRLDIKMKQYIIAIFQHKYIQHQHYLEHQNTVQKMVNVIKQYRQASHEAQKNCQFTYYSIITKLNMLNHAFRTRSHLYDLSRQRCQQLDKEFEKYNKLLISPII